MKRLPILAIFALLLTIQPIVARTWTSTAGTKIEASFVAFSHGTVVLRRDDNGKPIELPMSKLSVDDQKFIMEETGWGRVWESSDGRKVIADFVSATDRKVTLETMDGKQLTSAIDRFSKADQDYIEARKSDQQLATVKVGDRLAGKVVGIADGDTITLLVGRSQVKVRLEGIDAPEKGQDFGEAAKKQLSKLIGSQEVEVMVSGRDKYSRLLGFVRFDDGFVNDEMLRSGFAWHYKEFNSNQALAKLEQEARDNKRGLWSQPGPIPPWEWRKWGDEKRKQWLAEQEAKKSEVEATALAESDAKSEPASPIRRPTRPRASSMNDGLRMSAGGSRSSAPPRTPSIVAESGGYWLTSNSKVRHNSSCRWFRNSKGRECSASDGKPCHLCGG